MHRMMLSRLNIALMVPAAMTFLLAAGLALALALTAASAALAAEKKVLKIAFRAAETGFDPQRIEDRYSVGICENFFDSLLTYDWLALPVKLVPQHPLYVPSQAGDFLC